MQLHAVIAPDIIQHQPGLASLVHPWWGCLCSQLHLVGRTLVQYYTSLTSFIPEEPGGIDGMRLPLSAQQR
jgi:hypothetical protein